MKKLLLVAPLIAISAPAHATCGAAQPDCVAYTKGLSYVNQNTPVRFFSEPDNGYFLGFSEIDFDNTGLTDETQGGSVPLAVVTPVLWNAVKELDVKVESLSATKTFNAPSRTLNNCYQISSTKDALVSYAVDVSTALSLTSGAEGTVTMTSYTNSGCTTGAVNIASGSPAQTGTLIVGLGVNQKVPVALSGMVPAGKWVKITTANTVGTPTFAIRSTQQEVLF